MKNLDRCAIHTMTTKAWDLPTACSKFSAAGVKGVGVWRQWLEGRSLAESKSYLDDNGLTPVSLVRGGFFTAKTPELRQAAIDENKKCLDEAAAFSIQDFDPLPKNIPKLDSPPLSAPFFNFRCLHPTHLKHPVKSPFRRI